MILMMDGSIRTLILKNKFIEVLGNPNDEYKLDEYLKICVDRKFISTENYHESHHILPRSKFKEFDILHDKINLTVLPYDIHILAHTILAQAYTIKSFITPLCYMLSIDAKEKIKLNDMRKLATKNEWKEFKKDTERYHKWREALQPTWDKIRERNKETKGNWSGDHEIDNKRKEIISRYQIELWNNKKYREKITVIRNTAEWKEKISKSTKNYLATRYANEKYYTHHVEKMTVVNKDENKRSSASNTLRKRWKEKEFIDKTISGMKTFDAQYKRKNTVWSKNDCWYHAEDLFYLWSLCDRPTCYQFKSLLGDTNLKCDRIIINFNNGWCPSICPFYQKWIKENETNKN